MTFNELEIRLDFLYPEDEDGYFYYNSAESCFQKKMGRYPRRRDNVPDFVFDFLAKRYGVRP